MKSRLQLIVVLLFIGIAGAFFIFSGKESDKATELEVVEETDDESYKEPETSAGEIVKPTPDKNISSDVLKEEIKIEEIFVHVCGAVKAEGVYKVMPDSRVIDAIQAAGGLTEKAASYGINQAEALKDGMQIYVPTKKEILKAGVQHQSLQSSASENVNSNNLQSGTININTASKEDLMKLNGVGEAKAALIINFRESNGGFKNITDLMQIKGIKQKFFDKIKDNICV